MRDEPAALEHFFGQRDQARLLFEKLRAMIEMDGPVAVRVDKSQVVFVRARPLARAWLPDMYLGAGHAPLVLALGLRQRDPSPRWKQVVEARPGRFTHHLELYEVEEIDAQVQAWVRRAEQENT